MKKLAIVFICALAIVASCSKKTTAPTTAAPTPPPAPTQPAPQPQSAADEATLKLFAQHCGKCHGPTGVEGRAPKLWNMHESKAQIVDIIKNGMGRMPALGGDMSNAEAELLADYVLTIKKP